MNAKEDNRMLCPKCGKRINKFTATSEKVYEWYGDKENGTYDHITEQYIEVHHCGGILASETI